METTKHVEAGMNIVPLLLFCSLGLVTLSVLFFVYLFRQNEYDQADRMALAPLRDDDPNVVVNPDRQDTSTD